MKRTKTFAFFVTVFVLSLANCSKKVSEDSLSIYHGVHGADVKSMDPAVAYDPISWDIVPQIYESLYQYSYLSDPLKVVPLLAADFPEYSRDRLTLTIPILRGIKFQNDSAFKDGKGRELTAEDFVFAFKRLALPSVQSRGWWIFDRKIRGITEFHKQLTKASETETPKIFAKKVEGIQAIDKYTLQIKLTRPYPQLLHILTLPLTSPVAREVVETHGNENGNIHENPVGTGPYMLKKWHRGHRIILERNANYHASFYPTEGHPRYRKAGLLKDAGKTLPFLDRISIDVVKESQPSWLSFLAGKIDRMGIPKDNYGEAVTDRIHLTPEFKKRGIHLDIEKRPAFNHLSFNMKDPVLGKNKYLRQALSSAIDRKKYIELFTNGRAIHPTAVIPPGIEDRPSRKNLKYDYNLDRAKSLLKKAGYPGGKGLRPLTLDSSGTSSIDRQQGEFFAKQFSEIGVKIKVIYNTFPAFLEKKKSGNTQILSSGWTLDYPDAENGYQLLYGPNGSPGPNDSNFNHPKMNELYKKMSAMEPGPKRAKVIQEMDDLFQEETPWALLFYRVRYHLSHPWLKNYRPHAMINNYYKYLRLERKK